MNNYREILIALGVRLVPALVVGWLGWRLLATASGGWAATPQLLFGMACFLLGATLIARPVARLLAEPTGNLFYPGRRFERPLPMYSIPESQRARGLYEEALAGFEKIGEAYPGEIKPHIEMIDICIVNLKDPERARAVFEKGLTLLKKEEDRKVLASMYAAICTRLHARP